MLILSQSPLITSEVAIIFLMRASLKSLKSSSKKYILKLELSNGVVSPFAIIVRASEYKIDCKKSKVTI